MELDSRMILKPEDLIKMQAAKEKEKHMEGVKQGAPWEELVDTNDENSLLSKYIARKTDEYNKRMETFDEELEQAMINRELGEDEDDVVIAGGEVDYKGSSFRNEYKKPDVKINPDKIVDDLF